MLNRVINQQQFWFAETLYFPSPKNVVYVRLKALITIPMPRFVIVKTIEKYHILIYFHLDLMNISSIFLLTSRKPDKTPPLRKTQINYFSISLFVHFDLVVRRSKNRLCLLPNPIQYLLNKIIKNKFIKSIWKILQVPQKLYNILFNLQR